jgi:hypothetical protein
MNAKVERKMDVPDVTSLLGKIGASREAVGKAPLQEVRPVQEPRTVLDVNTSKRKNVQTDDSPTEAESNAGGRPTVKSKEIKYARLSPRIPVDLKTELDVVLAHKQVVDAKGTPIRYIDEFVAEAIRRMLADMKKK